MIPLALRTLATLRLSQAGAGVGAGPGSSAFDLPASSLFDGALFGWLGYALVCLVLLGVWISHQNLLLRRRRWIRQAEETLGEEGVSKLHRLFRHADFQRTVGDLTEVLHGFEGLLAQEDEARRELEKELSEARHAFEALPQAGIILDAEGYLLAATPEARELFGRPESALVGERLARFVQGDLDGGSPCTVRVAAPGGEFREVHLFLRTIGKSHSDHRIGLLIETHHLTTAEALPGHDGRSGQTMEAMGEFAGSVAHDFNDHLTAILGHSYVLLGSTEEGGELRENVEEIANAAEQARLLTQQLLAFSRRGVTRPETLDVVAFLREMDGELRFILGDSAELEVRSENPTATVRFDPLQLNDVIVNLVRNAREAMGPSGRVLIQVATAYTLPPDVRGPAAAIDPDESWVCISVVDSGPGMDPDTLVRAFDPYFTTHRGKGRRGMGLPTVYGSITQHRGRVAASNAVDRGFSECGMVFEIYLPPATAIQSWGVTTTPNVLLKRSRKRVCVVEDDAQVRRLVSFILNRDGFDVITAEDGREALRICEERAGDIDLVLTDLNMPYVGGLELAEELRRRFPNTKTIFMSGFIEEDALRPDAQAPTSFLQKPFTPKELLDHVNGGLSYRARVEAAPRILVVDDEKPIRDMVGALLESLGYDCHKACDGSEALWKMRTLEVDLVISDMVMPKMDGIQTCLEIRKNFPNTRIIAMSGKAGGAANLSAAMRLGATAILTKPFSRDELKFALEEALETVHE